jgi:hypothetical protein
MMICLPVTCDREDQTKVAGRRKEILDSLSKGELNADEAVKLLKQKYVRYRLK